MVHRIVTLVLLAILAIVHAQLWLGSYSMDHVRDRVPAEMAAPSAASFWA